MISAYAKRIFSTDESIALKYSKAWSEWEYKACKIVPPPEEPSPSKEDEEKKNRWAVAMARIETHYFLHKSFLTNEFLPQRFKSDANASENFILDNLRILNDNKIPVTIIQGRLDLVCPLQTAWDVKNRLPSAKLRIIDEGVHSSSHILMANAMVEEVEALANGLEAVEGDARCKRAKVDA